MKTGAAYPEYKSSGVPWLGDVPAHWKSTPLKYSCSFFGGGTPSKDNPDFWTGDIPWVSPKDMKTEWVEDAEDHITARAVTQSATQMVPLRSVLVVVRSGILKHTIPVAINTRPVALNQDMRAIVPRSFLMAEYLAWFLRGSQSALLVDWRKAGATVESLEADLMKATRIPRPPLDEQRAIAEFLDRETGKLDALVQKKEQLLVKLQEKRTALISHAFTKGLNPAAPMKDSGIPWLGKIPAHWRAKRLKFLLNRIEQGWSPQCDNQPADEGKWGVLKTGCVNGGVFNAAENKALPDGMEPPLEYEVRPGDVLMSRASGSAELVGSVAMVTEQPPARLLLSDKTYRLPVRPQEMDAQLLVWAMGSPMVRHQIAGFISGAEGLANNITQGDIRRIVLAVPPLAEQRDIIQRVRAETTKLDALIAKVRTGIERLQEYRTALISAAVTGKIDVRQAQPSASKVVKLPPAAFRRAVFAAEVIHQLHDEPTFGHVKCQKILHLAEHHLGLPDFESNYFRQAAGPYDNQMMRSIDGQLERLKWFRAVKHGEAWHYDGLANAGQHEKYFGQYWGQHQDGLQKLLALLRKLDTERCEILSTLYAVWNDFLLAGASFDDAKLADEAIRWHPAKQRIERDRWLKALGWMREKGLVPRGTGKPTKVKK